MSFVLSQYWDRRYRKGVGSGAGSRGLEAREKAEIVNHIIRRAGIQSVLDVGVGDGVVSEMIDAPAGYVGYDISETAISLCREMMPDRTFTTTLPAGDFDLIISMDVIFHLVNEDDYQAHLALLFGPSPEIGRRAVLVYATNHDERGAAHVLHRKWTNDVPPTWSLTAQWRSRSDKRKSFWLLEEDT